MRQGRGVTFLLADLVRHQKLVPDLVEGVKSVETKDFVEIRIFFIIFKVRQFQLAFEE